MDSFAMIALILVLIGIFLYFRISSSVRKCCDTPLDVELPVKVKKPTTKPKKPKKKRVYKRKKKK